MDISKKLHFFAEKMWDNIMTYFQFFSAIP